MNLFKQNYNQTWLLYSSVFCIICILMILPFYIENHREVIILEKKIDSINKKLYQNETTLKKREKEYDEKEKKQRSEIDSMKTEILRHIK